MWYDHSIDNFVSWPSRSKEKVEESSPSSDERPLISRKMKNAPISNMDHENPMAFYCDKIIKSTAFSMDPFPPNPRTNLAIQVGSRHSLEVKGRVQNLAVTGP